MDAAQTCLSLRPFLLSLGTDSSCDRSLYHPFSPPGLTKLKEILPKLRKSNTEIPRVQASTSPFGTSPLGRLSDIMKQTQDLLADCRYQTVKIVFGDRTLPKPTREAQ